ADHAIAIEHEGLDAEAAPRQLDRAILADQALLVAAVDADDGPVRLLAAEAARQPATGQLLRQRLDEVVGMRREAERLHLRLGQRVASAFKAQCDAARFRFGQGEPVAVAAALLDRAHRAPLAIGTFQLHHVALRTLAGIGPAQDQATELALLAEVQHHALAATGLPRRAAVAVDNAGCAAWRRAGLYRHRGWWRIRLRRQRLQRQLIEAHAA